MYLVTFVICKGNSLKMSSTVASDVKSHKLIHELLHQVAVLPPVKRRAVHAVMVSVSLFHCIRTSN